MMFVCFFCLVGGWVAVWNLAYDQAHSGWTGAPASALRVWRVDTKTRSGSTCPVKVLDDGTVLFLTCKHLTRTIDSDSTVVSFGKRRKLRILSHENHPHLDLAVLTVEPDGFPVDLFTISDSRPSLGEEIFAAGYAAPALDWVVFRGMSGVLPMVSLRTLQGMSGGPILLNNGQLLGLCLGGRHARGLHYREQTIIVTLTLSYHQDWFRKHQIIE